MIMWHQTESSNFSHSQTCELLFLFWSCKMLNSLSVLTEHIVDVREGQKSDGFDKYPYDEMENQSLSVIVEVEKQSKYNIYIHNML